MKIVSELIKIFLLFIPIVGGLEGDADGGAKKAEAIAQMKAILSDPNEPLNWPSFLKGTEDLFLGVMVNGAVRLAKAIGFFGSAKSSSSPTVPQ